MLEVVHVGSPATSTSAATFSSSECLCFVEGHKKQGVDCSRIDRTLAQASNLQPRNEMPVAFGQEKKQW